jgi:catechol-2,3-dioxygenase
MSAELGREVDYCHTFFALADGGALAFFQFADPEMQRRTKPIEPQIGRFRHIALKVGRPGYDTLVRRCAAAAVAVRQVDHGYCRSMYVTSPDGLIVEFTVDPPDVEAINTVRRADAHSELKRWLGGDRRPNNDVRPH